MTTIEETVQRIVNAPTWDQRIALVRQIPARHGTDDRPQIYAEVARQLYVAHLTPDYAYVPVEDFFEPRVRHWLPVWLLLTSVSAWNARREVAKSRLTCRNLWWACEDLNLGPLPYQGSALTA